MKQKLILLVVAILTATAMQADSPGLPVPLTKVVKTTPATGDNPRSPSLVPVLYLDGYTLTAAEYTVGSTIQLLDENDNVVFSTYVNIEGDIALPATLSGTYTILVIRDDAAFVGEITL